MDIIDMFLENEFFLWFGFDNLVYELEEIFIIVVENDLMLDFEKISKNFLFGENVDDILF